MVNLNPTTPQLKAVRTVVDTYASRDLNSSTIFSKNFKYQSFPKTADHVEETRDVHFQKYESVLSSYAKKVVSVRSCRSQQKSSRADIRNP